MLSVCIPAFNFDLRPLLRSLSLEIKTYDLPVDLIVVDDASESSFQLTSSFTAQHEVNYEILPKNIGRSKIRNYLATKSNSPYLLFLDGDSYIPSEHFLRSYLDVIHSHPEQVICGGRIYPDIYPSKDQYLSWNYGVKVESKTAELRNQHPHHGFMSNNFVIPKKVLQAIPFDESLVGYGHEDTLLGHELALAGVTIYHLQNPVLNGHIESNDVFLEKTEEGIRNMVHIIKERPALVPAFNLMQFYYRRPQYFHSFMHLLGHLFLRARIKKVLHKRGTLFLFQWYKYLYLIHLLKD